MDDRPEVKDLDPNFSFSSTGSNDYIPAPVNKPLKAHVDNIKTTTQIDQYKNRPDGTPNPEFGKEKDMYIFGMKLDESDAKGQVYAAWVSTACSEKSNLGKVSAALLGKWDTLLAKNDDGTDKYTVKDLLGLPLKTTLKPQKTNPDRLTVDVNKLFPPDEDQKRIEPDVVPTVTDLEDSGMAEAVEVFGK